MGVLIRVTIRYLYYYWFSTINYNYFWNAYGLSGWKTTCVIIMISVQGKTSSLKIVINLLGSHEKVTLPKYDQACIFIVQAVSIVRTKPQHMSGKVYAQVLNTQLTGNEKHWRSKVMSWKSEFLSASCWGEINVLNFDIQFNRLTFKLSKKNETP